AFTAHEAQGRDDQVRQEADGEEPGGAALHQGGDPRGALHERAASLRLSQRQERRAQAQRQGKRPPGGDAAVPGREDLSAGLRPFQAQEGGGEVSVGWAAAPSSAFMVSKIEPRGCPTSTLLLAI